MCETRESVCDAEWWLYASENMTVLSRIKRGREREIENEQQTQCNSYVFFVLEPDFIRNNNYVTMYDKYKYFIGEKGSTEHYYCEDTANTSG